MQRVQAVQREIGELCRTVGLSDAEEATVDAFERAVELARERCAAGERLAEEIQRQEAFCALYVRMQQHFVLTMGVIGFFQRILIVLRLAHFLILFPAEVGIGRG